jgi:hypothetical protein
MSDSLLEPAPVTQPATSRDAARGCSVDRKSLTCLRTLSCSMRVGTSITRARRSANERATASPNDGTFSTMTSKNRCSKRATVDGTTASIEVSLGFPRRNDATPSISPPPKRVTSTGSPPATVAIKTRSSPARTRKSLREVLPGGSGSRQVRVGAAWPVSPPGEAVRHRGFGRSHHHALPPPLGRCPRPRSL